MNDVKELQDRLEEIVKQLKPKHLKFAIAMARGDGKTRAECYVEAGFGERTAKQSAYKVWQLNPLVREYVDVAKLIALQTAQKELAYDEQRWLTDILEGVDMAMGRKKVRVVAFGEERELTETNLSAFAKFSEQLGKKLGLFKETVNLNAIGLVKSIPADTDPQIASEMYQDMIRGR